MRILTPLPSDSAAIRRARKAISDQLWAWGLGRLVDDAELITSELVTNAISHGDRLVELRLSTTDDRIRISVLDANPSTLPERRVDRGLQAGGRGLNLVELLAADWGFEILGDHKEVWAELPV